MFLGESEKEYEARKERERNLPERTLEEVELERKQNAARHSHKEMCITAFAVEWRTLDGKPLDNATSHPNPHGPASAAMSVALVHETINGQALPIMVNGQEVGSVRLTLGEYRTLSGVTY